MVSGRLPPIVVQPVELMYEVPQFEYKVFSREGFVSAPGYTGELNLQAGQGWRLVAVDSEFLFFERIRQHEQVPDPAGPAPV